MPINTKNDSIDTAMKKLKARENALIKLESVSGLGSWEIDLQTKRATWSQRSYEIYQVPPNTEVTLDSFFSRLSDDDAKTAKDVLDEALRTGEALSFTTRAKREDGTIITLLINGQVIYNEDKTPSKVIGTTQDITRYISLQTHANELSDIIEYSSNEIYIVNFDTLEYLYVNKGACDALGYSKEEMLQKTIRDINPYMKLEKIEQLKKELRQKGHILNRSVHQRKDTSTYHVQSYIHTITYKEINAYVIFDTDITQILKLEAEYKKQANILKNIRDSIITTDIYGNITSWNEGSSLLFGYKPDEVLGKYIGIIYNSSANEQVLDEVFTTLYEESSINTEAVLTTKDKKPITCNMSLSILLDENGIIEGYLGFIQDITQQQQAQKLIQEQSNLLKHQAYHDSLTNLPNRALFKDRLEQSMLNAKRNKHRFALLFIDLDQFKSINDSLGHDVGDKVLIKSAKRLQNSLRAGDTLARLGGDEFTIILKDVHESKDIAKVADKIIHAIKEPIEILSHKLHISCSIGISIFPDDANSQENLIKYADAAMYRAKDEGRNNYQFYSSDLTVQAYERVILENSLRIAIKEQQFIIHFQPQYHEKGKKIVGMEALVRWQHPELGLVFPDKFISLAQETGLIIEIDKIVMQKAMQQFSKWYEEGLNPGVLALNLSMKQLNNQDFIPLLLETMQVNNFKAQWLELELLESQIMHDPDLSIDKLRQIHNLGIEIAIDDFGTGYSSLSYLKKLPLDKLKIDKSFIDDIPKCEDDIAITKAIIALAQALGLKLVAEGVETKEQLDFLQQNKCNQIQGYYFSKPLPAQEIRKLL